MSILQRLKKKKHEGFKQFVRSLEQTIGKKKIDIVQKAILEDPIYVKHALKNMLPFDHLIEMSSDDIESIVNHTPNAKTLFAKALKNDECLDDYLNSLPNQLGSEIREEIEYLKDVSQVEQENAKSFILKAIRDLQESGDVTSFQWDYPDDIILKDFHRGKKDGHYQDFFENDILACEGELKRGRRIGAWKHFYDNGKLMATGEYENGVKEGPWEFYYSSGKLKMKGLYKDDSRDGEWEEYDASGNKKLRHYDLGKPLD